MTLAEWTAGYLEGARHKRATTRARGEIVLRKHFLPALGARPIASITPLDVRRVVETMNENLAPATVRTNYAVLKAVLNAAVEADVLVKSPCRGVRLPSGEKRERAVLSPDALERLAAAMRPEFRAVAYVAAVVGDRRAAGSAPGLPAADVDGHRDPGGGERPALAGRHEEPGEPSDSLGPAVPDGHARGTPGGQGTART